ncbi:MAG TPA: short-chain dehydrogenase [Rhodobacteraceae bacterium]|jgi:NAD(P)-dependent dehydrogenase (short-subunit alcohol dehydrogenase family)|nr:SDR family NAD(P)-dependent oxidoreductase [Rhodobacter sp.]HBN29717.1 short-chain dehydrogenase [Paracoccaceae bacterium]
MSQKSILITGCSSGIGYDAAHSLAKRGWRVFATCRAEADCERLRSEGLESFRLDYADNDSIHAAMTEVEARTGGGLDALYNNGAYAIPGAMEDVPTDAMRAIFEANVFGWHELTNLVIPLMRAQGHGRIVNCSSVLGMVSMPWRGAYNATKYAVEAMSDTLRMELRRTGIKVVLIEPGPITTAFRANAKLQFDRWIDWENAALEPLYRNNLVKRLNDATQKKDRFELPPSAVTAKLIQALESVNPRPRYFVTVNTYLANFMRRLLPTRLIDMILAGG